MQQMIYKMRCNNEIWGYVTSHDVALQSLRISYSAFPTAKFIQKLTTIEIQRKGFNPIIIHLDVEYLIISPQHL